MSFSYYMPVRVFFGSGCVAKNAGKFSRFGERALVLTGKNSAKASGALADVDAALNAAGVAYEVFDKVENNPSLKTAVAAAEAAKAHGAAFVIGIGGGSPIDVAKAAAVFAANPEMEKTDIFKSKYRKALPILAVPTTAGTGSEVTPYSVLLWEEKQTKLGFGAPATYPSMAFVDPGYTATLSLSTTINTAIDALSHALGGYLSKRSSRLTDGMALDAMAASGGAMDALLEGSIDAHTRAELMYASMLGGIVIAQAGVTLEHGMGYCYTCFKDTPHGRANGYLMREFLRLNYPYAKEKIDKAMQVMGFADSQAFSDTLERLLGRPPALSAEEVERYTELSLLQKGSIVTTPAPVDRDVLHSLWSNMAKVCE